SPAWLRYAPAPPLHVALPICVLKEPQPFTRSARIPSPRRVVSGVDESFGVGHEAKDSPRIIRHARDVPHGAIGVCRIGHFGGNRSEEHTSELQSRENIVCRLL